jgi:hypothetical protein
VRDWLAHRDDFVQVMVIAVLLALGVNLLAAALLSSIALTPALQWLLGGILTVLALTYLAGLVFGTRVIRRTFEGFLIFSDDLLNLVPVPEYEFSEHVSRALMAAITESRALRRIWEDEPLLPSIDLPRAGEEAANSEMKGARIEVAHLEGEDAVMHGPARRPHELLQEAIEFAVLEELSLHLSGYFQEYLVALVSPRLGILSVGRFVCRHVREVCFLE